MVGKGLRLRLERLTARTSTDDGRYLALAPDGRRGLGGEVVEVGIERP